MRLLPVDGKPSGKPNQLTDDKGHKIMTEQLTEQLAQNAFFVSTQDDRALLYALAATVKTLAAQVAELETRLAVLEPDPEP